ncbi:Ribosome biobiogenesis protein brx1 [Microsporum canis]|uniref:Ribosome biogenesis protein BRX1 n=1 Tax=Arthroderma otae (strain ATCC MYA-4605 / CBS 113480) TaxID=554155 RepID=C5FVQ5_ARTOC|nr:ribosome biogenesis protein BRX1 [Microsporum canis CBS 113480]EEQ33989.1 ribosome biogenesis protein BRX1 [Microsporum canis CBS 113480]
MASVYKSLSKRKKKDAAKDNADDEDIDMDMEQFDDDDSSDEDGDKETSEDGLEDGSDDGEEEDGDINLTPKKSPQSQKNPSFMPKTRVLVLTSRGVSYRHRHLVTDLTALLPHTYKESKLDTKKSQGYNFLLNSLADLHSCNVVFFLEARKQGQDLYLWLSRPPNGPTLKFSVTNLHTMGELGTGFAGNCLKGGRGIVVFDPSFDDNVVLQRGNEWRGLVREMLRSVFSVPKRGVRGMKPFVDRVIGIFAVDGKIWVRVYEIRETDVATATKKAEEELENAAKKKKSKGTSASKGGPEISLVEIGPRFVLTPIVILEGSFGGPVIYENREYVSPNQVRREIRMKKATRYTARRTGQIDRNVKKTELGLNTESSKEKKVDELDSRVLFA